MRVSSVSGKDFTKDEMLQGDFDKEEGIVCDGTSTYNFLSLSTNNYTVRLFITKTGDDPIFCDGTNNCHWKFDEKYCSLFVNISFEGPILTTVVAVALGILLFSLFSQCLNGRGDVRFVN